MPIMHRLACLRDDVIFFIFCYQRYKYKTDYTRVNEFGQCEDPTEEMLKEKEVEDASATAISNVPAVTAENRPEDEAIELEKVLDHEGESVVRRRRGARERKETQVNHTANHDS